MVKTKQLVERFEVTAGMPFHIDTQEGSLLVTLQPVKDKFRTYEVSVEFFPVNGKVLTDLKEVRNN